MNSRSIFLAFCLLSLCVSVSCHDWAYCAGTKAGHLTVSNVTLSPDPVSPGNDETVSLAGTLDEAVTGGNISLTITWMGIPVYSKDYQMCSTISCPYTNKEVSASILVPGSSIPPFSPPGTYTGTAILLDQNAESLACITLTFVLPGLEDK